MRHAAQGLAEGTVVAIKRYKAWVLEEPGFIERLFREVDTGRTIVHPNVLRVFGAVIDSDARPALVMQLHEGRTLAEELQRRRSSDTPYDFDTATSVLRCVAAGLIALHERGVVHRDIKPANILVHEGDAIIADFGVVSSAAFPEQTATGAFLGTIRYAAPEYLFGERSDSKIDVYSFGCLAYEIFTNSEAFGEQAHWARLVAAKDRLHELLTAGDLKSLALRFGMLRASFIRLLVESSMSRYERLALTKVLSAIDGEVWTHVHQLRDAEFEIGPFAYDDAFETAEEATEALRALGTSLKRKLIALLDQHYWAENVPIDEVESELIDCGAVRSDGHSFHFDGAVREAYVRDLLSSFRSSK